MNEGHLQEVHVKYGARNQMKGRVTSINKGDIMSLVKVKLAAPATVSSVITTESVDEMKLRVDDEVLLVVKAIHVLPVKE